jgi:hypothetical protein
LRLVRLITPRLFLGQPFLQLCQFFFLALLQGG